ncbi:hypothetical protein RI129_006358 [Pyrocoelia pectoralis]|uniref:O-acyltransferase n=1 Tax=Pyrocoelia pectoralis TaxID=417401 RepID=A0AAN7VE05_9COLE
MVSEIANVLENSDDLERQLRHLFNKNSNDEIQDKVHTKKGHLPDKVFMARNSFLTDLLEINHIQTIYHIFIALLFGLFVNSTTYDMIHTGQTKMGFDLIIRGFANIHILLFMWICMFFTSCFIYVMFHIWASLIMQLHPQSFYIKLWNKICLGLYLMHVATFVYLFTYNLVIYKLTAVESVAILCEIMRIVMKTHAFVRTNVPIVLQYKPHTEADAPIPEFSKFLYFLFIPTLIYKNSYPRTKSIRWGYVCKCFIEVFGCIVYISFVTERFLIQEFREFGLKSFGWKEIILIILGNGLAGILVLLNTFYAVLHSWMNGFAEMLRFGDRMFYKDWWTSTTYSRYYRTWNVIVHDWLYTYIYKDMYENVVPGNKLIAKLTVFFVSAVVHEYILGFTFRFCFPILFIEFFGIGVAISFLKSGHKVIGNAAVWYGLGLGMGIGISAYALEYYARLNCPVEDSGLAAYFIPRSIFC